MRKFKTLGGIPIDSIVDYIKEYISTHDNIDILIGTDSQSRGKETVYATVIVLYTRGRGGHVLVSKKITPKERVIPVKLLNEVWMSVEVAEFLKENDVPKPRYIDVDLNPDPRWASNKVLRDAVGLVEGMGYSVRYKHNGAMSTYAADHVVKH